MNIFVKDINPRFKKPNGLYAEYIFITVSEPEYWYLSSILESY